MRIKWSAFVTTNMIVWKMPLAAAISWEIAKWAGSSHPYLAPLTVILSLQATVGESLKYAWQRSAGTIAGVLFSVATAPYFGLNGWSIGLMLLIGAAIAAALRLEHAIMIQVALSILLVMYFQSKMPSYPFDRIRDTLVGAVVTVLLQMLVLPPDSVTRAQKKIDRFADHLANQFFIAAQWVECGCSSYRAQAELQPLLNELRQAAKEADSARQSLQYNLLASGKRAALNRLTRRLEQLRLGCANLSDMIRIFASWSENDRFRREDQQLWANHLKLLGRLIEDWKTVPRPAPLQPRTLASPIKAPPHIETYQYPLALYTNAEQLVQDFQR